MLASLDLDCAILKIKFLNFPDFGFKKKTQLQVSFVKKTKFIPSKICRFNGLYWKIHDWAVSCLANRRELHQIVKSGVGGGGRKLLTKNALFQARPPF